MMGILILSVLAGMVTAGLTWYTWSLMENVGAMMAARKQAQPDGEAEDEPRGEPEAKPEAEPESGDEA
ncbi:MAG: hypothetical protein GY851_08290 [bacterium]|nr:hypothetical protein [bacterium]